MAVMRFVSSAPAILHYGAGRIYGDPATTPQTGVWFEGQPAARLVLLEDYQDHELLAMQWSGADGTYEFPHLADGLYRLIARDYAGEYQDAICAPIRPEFPP